MMMYVLEKKIVCLLLFALLFSSIAAQTYIREREEPVSNVGPFGGILVSSSELSNYRFYNPFIISNVNSAGDQFGYNKSTNTLSFHIQRMGETHSDDKRLYLIFNSIDVDYIKTTKITPEYDETYIVREHGWITPPDHSFLSVLPSATTGVQKQSKSYDLGVSDWREGVGVEVNFLRMIEDDFLMTIMVVNPNQVSRIGEEVIQHFAAPVRLLGRILGESRYSDYISFANFHFKIETTPENEPRAEISGNQPLNVLPGYIEEITFMDPRMGAIVMASVTGLSDEARRFRNNSGVNSLREYTVRKDTYKNVLRQIAFQPQFDASNLTGFYSIGDNMQDFTLDEDRQFFATTALSLTDFSLTLAEEIARYSNLRYEKELGNYTRQLNKFKNLGRHVRQGSLSNFTTALTYFSILTNSLKLSEEIIAISVTTSLLEAAKIDMALFRLGHLESLNIIEDRAYKNALYELIEELRAFNPNFWNNLAYSILNNQQNLINGSLTLANIATDVALLMGYDPVLLWVKSILFVAETANLIMHWRDTFREATCAATIYHYMRLHNHSVYDHLDEDIMDYSQYLFISQMEEVLSNNYMLVWEFLNSARREVRISFRDEHKKIKNDITKKRISKFIDVLFSDSEKGHISGLVISATDNSPLDEVEVIIYQGQSLKAQKTTDNEGSYLIELPVADNYLLEFRKTGFQDAHYHEVNVTADETSYLETVLQVDENYLGTGNVHGKIVDAFNGEGVNDVTIRARAGINARTGQVISYTSSRSDGSYNLSNLPGGNYTIEATKAGYITGYASIISIGSQTTQNQNVSITPAINVGEIRIVLDWGIAPADLDSHLTGPLSVGSGRFHISFQNKITTHNGVKNAALDLDVTRSYGPETITIYNKTQGLYRYSVHDYTNRLSSSSSALSNSSARVRVFMGNNLTHTFNVPTNRGGTVWTVFEIREDRIVPINNMSFVANPGSIY